MKLPLNYAILTYFARHEEGNADTVIEELAPEYGKYRAFKRNGVIEALMTAKENGILDEVRAEIAEGDNLRVWYSLSEYGAELVEKYL